MTVLPVFATVFGKIEPGRGARKYPVRIFKREYCHCPGNAQPVGFQSPRVSAVIAFQYAVCVSLETQGGFRCIRRFYHFFPFFAEVPIPVEECLVDRFFPNGKEGVLFAGHDVHAYRLAASLRYLKTLPAITAGQGSVKAVVTGDIYHPHVRARRRGTHGRRQPCVNVAPARRRGRAIP
ncbi:MAG: hypothetical protein BWY09_02634 [Candidatus Hydrogenedentes bacterium ADurb.Bin179]|nr:MAG: hypothetical protein BWY09_02634 [Candidatus Hydrogenedentes bacterium ADurb.Bin179]